MTSPTPIENPFWNGGTFRSGRAVDEDTMRSLRVLHTLCGQLASSSAEAAAGLDRLDNLVALLDDVAAGSVGETGAHGHDWGTILTNHVWDLTQLYARTALDYAWASSRVASKLAAGQRLTPLTEWPDNERHPGGDWLTTDPGRRMYPVQLPAPPPHLGPWYAEQVATLNPFLASTHQRMLDTVVQVLKVSPDDLRGDRLSAERLVPEDRTVYDPRRARLDTTAAALHTYATGCARAVVLLDTTSAHSGTDDGESAS